MIRVGWTAVAALLTGGAAVALAWTVYVTPDVDVVSAREPTDAIVALGGEVRTAQIAYDLAVSGAAPTVVISDPYGDDDTGFIDRVCADPPPGPEVVCFDPDPRTTRGEARFAADLAEREGWDRVAVMTTTYHVSRARFITERCVDTEVVMVDAGIEVSTAKWAYHFGYQTAGWARAFTQRGC